MSKYNFPYTLHEYLDQELAIYNGNAPEHVVRAKKEEYRKKYSAWHKKVYRERMRQVTLQFSKVEFEEIKAKATSLGVRVSSYIKQGIGGACTVWNSTGVKMKLMQLLDLIEECMYEGELQRLAECLSIVESIQKELE